MVFCYRGFGWLVQGLSSRKAFYRAMAQDNMAGSYGFTDTTVGRRPGRGIRWVTLYRSSEVENTIDIKMQDAPL